jgi:hypothetical protein
MSLIVLCPQCRCQAEKMAVVSELSRDGDAFYRCPTCSLICIAPPLEPVVGQRVFPQLGSNLRATATRPLGA